MLCIGLAGKPQGRLSHRSCGGVLSVSQVPPSLWARRGGYGKVVCTGGLSKSFGLSGLRCGWLVAPPELLQVFVHPETVLPKALHRMAPASGLFSTLHQLRVFAGHSRKLWSTFQHSL